MVSFYLFHKNAVFGLIPHFTVKLGFCKSYFLEKKEGYCYNHVSKGIERKFSDMTEIMNTLTGLMADNLWAAPVLSLLAGIITSFTPCSLASVPMLLACVGAVGADF